MFNRRRWLAPFLTLGLIFLELRGGPYVDSIRPLPKASKGDAERGEIAFLYSDLGSSAYGSFPRSVFEALPAITPEYFPEGWEGLGVVPNPDSKDGLPVGAVPAKRFGVEFVATNCAFCHAGRFNGKIVPGAPNYDLDVQEIMFTVEEAFRTGKVTTVAVSEQMQKRGKTMAWNERWLLGSLLPMFTKFAKEHGRDWFKDTLGPGRSDALNMWKRRLGVVDEHTTIVDLPAVFNQRLKARTLLDGSVTGDMASRVMLTELQKGRPPRDPLLHRQVFDDLVAYMTEKLVPPKYPYPIDDALASKGRGVFETTCSTCHGTYGEQPSFPNKRISLERVKTDPERAQAMTQAVADAVQKFDYKDYIKIEPMEAYAPPPLNGIWMTAPYFHNGSVPTLYHVLHEQERPKGFYRRWNQFDQKRVGFRCNDEVRDGRTICGKDEQQQKHHPSLVHFVDLETKGNSAAGHPFGGDLPEESKNAVLEYLKTL